MQKASDGIVDTTGDKLERPLLHKYLWVLGHELGIPQVVYD